MSHSLELLLLFGRLRVRFGDCGLPCLLYFEPNLKGVSTVCYGLFIAFSIRDAAGKIREEHKISSSVLLGQRGNHHWISAHFWSPFSSTASR